MRTRKPCFHVAPDLPLPCSFPRSPALQLPTTRCPLTLLPMLLLLDTAGVVAIQNVHDTIKGWRISATGVVLEQDAQFRQVKADERLPCLCPEFTFCTVEKNNAARCRGCQAYHGLCRLLVLALAPVADWFHVPLVSPAHDHDAGLGQKLFASGSRRGLTSSALLAPLPFLSLACCRVVKKLKLVGTPFKVHRNTAFVSGMFNSQLEAAKFEGGWVLQGASTQPPDDSCSSLNWLWPLQNLEA